MSDQKIRQLFKSLSDCYADTWQGDEYEMKEGDVIQAMTEDRFIETINEAIRLGLLHELSVEVEIGDVFNRNQK